MSGTPHEFSERKFLSERDLCVRWGFPRGTLASWRSIGRGPRFVRFETAVRYPLEAVEEYERQAENGTKKDFHNAGPTDGPSREG